MGCWKYERANKTMFVMIAMGVLCLILISTSSVVFAASLRGELELDFDYHRQDEEFGTQGILQLEFSGWAGENVHLHTGMDLRFDRKELAGELDKARLTFFGDKTDLILGWQKVTWGAVDFNSPVDNINPRDLSRPFDADNKITVPALRLRYFHPEFELDALWQPYATPARFAEPGERWAMPAIENIFAAYAGAVEKGLIDEEDMPDSIDELRVYPKRNFKNSVFGLRVSRSTPSFDFALSYFYGISQEPAVIGDPVAGDFQLKHYRQQIIGGEMVYGHGSFILRSDLALILPEKKDNLPGEKLQYAITGEGYLTRAIAVFGGVRGEQERDKTGKHSVLAGIDYQFDFYTQLSLGLGYGLGDGDFMVNPEFSRSLADGTEIRAGIFYFSGKEEGFFGQFSQEDHFYISIKQAFAL